MSLAGGLRKVNAAGETNDADEADADDATASAI